MPKIDLSALIAQLTKLGSDLPNVLTALQQLLANAQTNMAPLSAFLAKFFPNLDVSKLEATVVADLKVAVDFLSSFGPEAISGLVGALNLLNSLFPKS